MCLGNWVRSVSERCDWETGYVQALKGVLGKRYVQALKGVIGKLGTVISERCAWEAGYGQALKGVIGKLGTVRIYKVCLGNWVRSGSERCAWKTGYV